VVIICFKEHIETEADLLIEIIGDDLFLGIDELEVVANRGK